MLSRPQSRLTHGEDPHGPRKHGTREHLGVYAWTGAYWFQSGPSTWPRKAGSLQAMRQVATLREPVTVRTVPSPRATCMAPGWGVWVRALVQSASAGWIWMVRLPAE